MHFMSLIIFRKSKMIFKSFLNSYVYWDNLYDNSRFPVGQNALYSAASVAQKFDFAQEIRKSEIWSGEVILNKKRLSERFASIFYLCEQFVFLVKQKQKKFMDFIKKCGFSKFNANLWHFEHPWTFPGGPGVIWGPRRNVCQIGSAASRLLNTII